MIDKSEKIKLALKKEYLSCINSKNQYEITPLDSKTICKNDLNALKEKFKLKLGSNYQFLVNLFSPVCYKDLIKQYLNKNNCSQKTVINLGSGVSSYNGVIGVDCASYEAIDVICDILDLPFEDNTIDLAFSVAVIEHLPNPDLHVREVFRVLKPGGKFIAYVPFMQPFHASPDDFQRYTESGLKQLFSNFECKSIEVGAGPTSSLLWIFQEWLALVLSFGNKKIYKLIYPLTWILSPLKYIDLILSKHPCSNISASALVIEVTKPA